jgi:hypothetical protein
VSLLGGLLEKTPWLREFSGSLHIQARRPGQAEARRRAA